MPAMPFALQAQHSELQMHAAHISDILESVRPSAMQRLLAQ
jgi:hypothetical protein